MGDFQARPVFDWVPNWTDGFPHGLLDDHSYDTLSGGLSVPWKPTTKPKRTIQMPFLLGTYQEIQDMRSFIAAQDGARLGFWLPTWLTDFEITTDAAIDDTTIRVSKVGVGDKLTFSSQFRYIAIATPSKLELYRIESSTIDGDEEVLTLSRGLDTAITASQTVCCGALYARLAEEDIAFVYQSGECATVNLSFVELPIEADGSDVEGTRPVYLYRLTRGALSYLYTSWPTDLITDEGQPEELTWTAADIEHGSISIDLEFANDPVPLTIATDDTAHPLRALLSTTLIEVTEVEIFETTADALELASSTTIYKGRLGQVTFGERGKIDVEMSSILRVGEQQVPRVQLQRTCAHRTYDGGCGLTAGTFTTTGTITGLGDSYVDANAFGTKASAEADPNWFALGKVTCGNEVRLCVGQSANRLYLNAPFEVATVGASVSAQAGDDKKVTTCEAKFGNVSNFLGFPYVPNQNPQFEALATPAAKGGKK